MEILDLLIDLLFADAILVNYDESCGSKEMISVGARFAASEVGVTWVRGHGGLRSECA